MNTLFLKKVDGWIGSGLIRSLPRPRQRSFSPAAALRLLLIRPGGIGDAVLLVPALLVLRSAWPDAVIHILSENRNVAVFDLCPAVDAVFRYDRPKELLTVLGGKYDVVIDTEQWHRLSAVMARIIRSTVKIGFATNERKRLFNDPIPYAQETYEAISFLNLLEPLGIAPPRAIETPFLEVNPSARKRAGELLEDLLSRPFVALFPGASIPERRWGVEKFQAVVATLAPRGISSVILGGREVVAEGAKIVAGTKGLSLAGRTSLAETAALIEKSALLVSGDSGILHIAVGLGKPTVSLFGPGIADKWAPQGHHHIVLDKNLSCSPCTRFGYTPHCSNGSRCLSQITADEVVAAIETVLSRL